MKSKLFMPICFAAAIAVHITGCSSMTQSPTPEKLKEADEIPLAAQDPAELYQELFVNVQTLAVFPDSKTFVDMLPNKAPAEILSDYRREKPTTREALSAFVATHFLPPNADSVMSARAARDSIKIPIQKHIKNLWKELTRQPDKDVIDVSSLIPLPYPYVVPGGRFREIYYWDTYFTQLGLLADNEDDLFKGMVKNFSHLILSIGRVPNGNRDYYRSRSQPPFFAYMISLWQDRYGIESATQFLPALKREHDFWMSGGRMVRLEGGRVLNRYWDDKDVPRPEAYKEDAKHAQEAASHHGRKPADVYRDIRAAAESGWDFSSRWFKQENEFSSISTTDVLPVDLNSLLYHLEVKIADLSAATGDTVAAEAFRTAAAERKSLLQTLFWNAKTGAFHDYSLSAKALVPRETIAMVVPLFVGVATPDQAKAVGKVIKARFLKPGGLVTTLQKSGEQWDAPNGWAPHQWMGYAGLRRYHLDDSAENLRQGWMKLNERVYRMTGKIMEKYNVVDLNLRSGGGEYPNQDGFGWSNGVYRAFVTPQSALKHLEIEP